MRKLKKSVTDVNGMNERVVLVICQAEQTKDKFPSKIKCHLFERYYCAAIAMGYDVLMVVGKR